MATVRPRTAATSAVQMQPLTTFVSQPATQIATSQTTQSHLASPHPPVVTQPAIPPIQGTSQTAISQPTAPAASTSTAGTPHSSTTVPTSSPGPPTTSSIVSSPPQIVSSSPQIGAKPSIESRWDKWEKWINSPVGWISIIFTLVVGNLTYRLAIKAWNLQVWSAQNDQRDSCWADRDHGLFSKVCNETLAHSATSPPLKRTGPSPDRAFFKDGPDRDQNFVSLIALIATITGIMSISLGYLIRPARIISTGEAQALRRRQNTFESTWTGIHNSFQTRNPFLRRKRVVWALTVSLGLLPWAATFLLPTSAIDTPVKPWIVLATWASLSASLWWLEAM